MKKLRKFGICILFTIGLLSEAGAQNLIQFDLIDTEVGKPIAGYTSLSNSQTINLSQFKGKKLSIEARVQNGLNEQSVRISLGTSAKTENEAPYSVFGDADGKFKSAQFPLGNINLSAEAFSEPRAKGKLLASSKILLKISNDNSSPPPVVVEPPTDVTLLFSENDGKISIELENLSLSSGNKAEGWASESLGGVGYIVYKGKNYDGFKTVSGIPARAKLSYPIKINAAGTFKFFFNSRREINGSSDDSENDVFIGIAGIQDYEKVYTNLTRGIWSLGGRTDRVINGKTIKMIPEYKFNQAGTYVLEIMPRSPNFKIDRIQLERLNTTQPPVVVPEKKSCGTIAHGGKILSEGYPSLTVPNGQVCRKESYVIATCNDGVSVPAKVDKTYHDKCTVLPPDLANGSCSNGMKNGEEKLDYYFDNSKVPAGNTCIAKPYVATKCTNGLISSATMPANKFSSCYVESSEVDVAAPMPAVNGNLWCYENRNNWDVIPNVHAKKNVGHISPESQLKDFREKYPNDYVNSGSSKIIIKTGNKVYSGFKTTYSVEVMAANVTMKDFLVTEGGLSVWTPGSADNFKGSVYPYSAVFEDGEIRRTYDIKKPISSGSGIGLNGANWKAYRVYIHGYGDAVRTEGNNVLAYSLTRKLGPLSGDHADMAQSINRDFKLPIKNVIFFRNVFLHLNTEDQKYFPTDSRPSKMNNVLNLMGEWKAYDNLVYSESFVASGSKEASAPHFFNNCIKTNGRAGYGANDWEKSDWHHNMNLDTGKFVDLLNQPTSEKAQ
jgi:hypothetical protein